MENKILCDINDFLINGSLYEKFKVPIDNVDILEDLIDPDNHIAVKLYCNKCKGKSVFRNINTVSCNREVEPYTNRSRLPITGSRSSMTEEDIQERESTLRWNKLFKIIQDYEFFYLELECTLNNEHKLIYYFHVGTDYIEKVGQYPSFPDLNITEIDGYKSILLDIDLIEYKTAVHIFSNGSGIGSFVYLRRIFERLIEKKHQIAKEELGSTWEEENYQKFKMNKKIVMLKDYLPSLLNRPERNIVYGVLSKGIHELDEEFCLTIFPLMKNCILLILEQDHAEYSRDLKEKEYRKKLNEINEKIKKKD